LATEKRKILVIPTGGISYEGITTVILNYFSAINQEGLDFDFIAFNENDDKLKEKILQLGGNILLTPHRKKDFKGYIKALGKIMKNKKYDIVHVHGNSATMTIETLLAIRHRIPQRIVHSHNSKCEAIRAHNILKHIFPFTYTNALACSPEAGEWLFKNKSFLVLKNAIDIQQFKFNKNIREAYRKEFNIKDDEIVIGHVGHFTEQKNHAQLIEIFKDIPNEKYKLLLIGQGPLKNNIVERIQELQLDNRVILLEKRMDVNKLMQAMDVFVFPSKWEGLGLVIVEAQTSGMLTVASTEVPEAARASELLIRISNNNPSSVWIEQINKVSKYKRIENDTELLHSIKSYGFDIYEEARKLRDIYLTDAHKSKHS